MNIEIKAIFKKTQISSSGTVLQFELSAQSSDLLPDIAKLTGSTVFLSITDQQGELPIEYTDFEEVDELPMLEAIHEDNE